MIQQRKGFTTVVDLEDFKNITWSFLVNIKMTWEYDGIAYLFREAGIPIYGFDRGTTKMNHPVMGIMIPPSKDTNYGVDLYVPVGQLKKARKLIADRDVLAEAAKREETEGEAHRTAFDAAARAAKERNARARKQRRREQWGSMLARLSLK